ncbi:hypothetical protein [Helicobacter brantae]|uniref:Molecular chaperone DnaK n=1 Tax=Helicobacter brantae TaxID=375927 RepID=A0A3D8J2R2_9HELI|nr:hypothetical protein [Helicobacter brantae]RDU71832.1 hypothetical protein CQA58_01970 [Helicobacter brantae]
MSEQIKQIDEIILHKNEPLAKELESKPDEIAQVLLNVEKIVANSLTYPQSRLTDPNLGHWDIYRDSEENKSTISIPLSRPLMARSPNLDIKKGVVAIDFGTKSTTVAVMDERSDKRLLRIGAGEFLKDDATKEDYENPTFMYFADIDSFWNDYHSGKSRPLTRWRDLSVAYEPKREFDRSRDGSRFYQYFADLKQWAKKNTKTPTNIVDTRGIRPLKNFVDCGEKNFNPIEVYAYYIGRYINNMMDGIYLHYVLSYPAKYPKNVREKLKESFERGLKKAIPYAVLTHPENGKDFEVEISVSEPAAYAISALKEYGFYSSKAFEKDKEHYYGVFDFGGGTTDFDFGVWRKSEDRRYSVEIEHFKSGGNNELGGENLLELLAYRVFEDEVNQKAMKEKGCSFSEPENYKVKVPGGLETLISSSQQAQKNTKILMEFLRSFWENAHIFGEKTNGASSEFETGSLQLTLVPEEGVDCVVTLKFDAQAMLKVLEEKIQEGVDQFFSIFEIASEKMPGLKKLHIFLGGNSSRSRLVGEAFKRAIEDYADLGDKLEFVLYPPLGTPESEKLREELGLNKGTEDYSRQVTCKSGVVFGLLDGLPSGKIKVIPEVSQDEEAKFEFYLGDEDFGCFEIIYDPNEAVGSEKYCIKDYVGDFILYYTKDPRAGEGGLGIGETRRMPISFNTEQEDGGVYVEILGPSKIRLIAKKKDGEILEIQEFDLED